MDGIEARKCRSFNRRDRVGQYCEIRELWHRLLPAEDILLSMVNYIVIFGRSERGGRTIIASMVPRELTEEYHGSSQQVTVYRHLVNADPMNGLCGDA